MYSKEEILKDMQRRADQFRKAGLIKIAEMKEKDIEEFKRKNKMK